jgi:hypothetical protein
MLDLTVKAGEEGLVFEGDDRSTILSYVGLQRKTR